LGLTPEDLAAIEAVVPRGAVVGERYTSDGKYPRTV
jgi:hypothetical protein